MSDALLVSNALLWAAVLALGAVVVALVRQVGVLHERVAPAGALMLRGGPQPGDAAPQVDAPLLAGGTLRIGAAREDGRATLLFFLSPSCPVCKALLPALHSLARRERTRLQVVLASDGPRSEHEAFVRRARLGHLPYALSADLGLAYGVARLPFAALIDAAGVLRAKGLVNSREHLESLLEALDRGVPSLQDHLAQAVPDAAAGDGAGRLDTLRTAAGRHGAGGETP